MALKERVLVEEQNLHDWNGKLHMKHFARKTSDVAGEETCRWFGNGFLKMGREGKAMQRLGMED